MENNNKTKHYFLLIFFYLFLTGLILTLIIKFGVVAAVKISELLQKNKESSITSEENFLSVPQFYPLLEATNSATLTLAGYSLPNFQVDIYLNDLNIKTLSVDSEGKFGGSISLALGINKIYGLTKDSQGRQSTSSLVWTIFYGNSPPFLEITEPLNGAVIKKQKNLSLKGKVMNTSKVFINEHLVITSVSTDSGYFTFDYPVTLSSGENIFKISCFDPAQNKTELEWIVNFQP